LGGDSGISGIPRVSASIRVWPSWLTIFGLNSIYSAKFFCNFNFLDFFCGIKVRNENVKYKRLRSVIYVNQMKVRGLLRMMKKKAAGLDWRVIMIILSKNIS
jgi:hypothetical protein